MSKKLDKAFIVRILIISLFALAVIYIDKFIGLGLTVWNAVSSLVLGCAIAFILNIVLNLLEKIYFPKTTNQAIIKTRRPVCITLSFLVVLTIIFLLFKLVIPQLVGAFSAIADIFPVYAEHVRLWLIEHSSRFPQIGEYLAGLEINWSNIIKTAGSYAISGIGSILGSTISIVAMIFGGLVNFIIGLIFAVYILASKEKLSAGVRRMMHAYIKPSTDSKIMHVLKTASYTFSRFIVGQCTEAVILGVLCVIGMMIFRFPYATMIGAVIGAMALIPIVGAYIGAAFGAFMIFTVSPLQSLFFLIFLIILQQLEGNLIYPKVVGSSIGLPGMWVLAAVTIGGALAGIPGMLIGVPLFATLYKLLRADIYKRTGNNSAASSDDVSSVPTGEGDSCQ